MIHLPRLHLLGLAGWLLMLLLCLPVEGHPVAQGSMTITVQPEWVEVRVRAANEQAFVAEAFGSSPATPKDGLAGVWQRHATYLSQHIFLTVEGAPLSGQVVAIQPSVDVTAEGRGEYELRFALPQDRKANGRVLVRQDVLNEFEFAPGNRWEATYVVRVFVPGATTRDGLLLTSREPLEISLAAASGEGEAGEAAPRLEQRALFQAYLRHGLWHILTGYDHLLFMAALVLAASSWVDLLKVVTAFTVAHTVTLTLSVLGWVRLPSQVVEPMIAASIVVVAWQNIFWPRQARGWSRLLMAFGFGLFHGLGFAGGLLEAMSGLPGLAVVTAITAFSLGVELGHQCIVVPVFGGLRLARAWLRKSPQERDPVTPFAVRYGSAVVSVCGLVYLVAALR